MSMWRCVLVVTVVVAGFAVSACGDDGPLPMSASEVEAFVMADLAEGGDVELQRVDCERGLAHEVGDTTSCTFTVEGLPTSGPFDVTVVKNDGGVLVPSYITGTPIDPVPGLDLFD